MQILNVDLLTYREHANDFLKERDCRTLSKDRYVKYFKKRRGDDLSCFNLVKNTEETYHLSTGYFVGADWIENNKSALVVAPKLKEIDYIRMLFSSLRHPEVAEKANELFEVKWDEPSIEIEQKQDLLTPFLVVEFLGLVKNIVRKGLKKSYYKVEKNMNSRVKGKVLVGQSIKKNILQNKNLYTYCTYDEFGYNNKENRLLKKALTFIKRYLPSYPQLADHSVLQNTFNFINPAFQEVSEKIELNEIKHSKTNVFYKEYTQAIRLAKLILKRFGYNISNTISEKIQTPPFWIDMSKLFELYVLGLLKDRFHHDIKFQYKHARNELDYLLKSVDYKMVIDAKYKSIYLDGRNDEDIRQVSGYARLNHIYDYLDIDKKEIVDCLIIHPDQGRGLENIAGIKLNKDEFQIPEYNRVFKLGVKLPIVKQLLGTTTF